MKWVLAICAALLLCAGPASAQFVPNSVANGKPCRGPSTAASEACVSKICAPGPTINPAIAADPHYCLASGRQCSWPGSPGESFGVQGRREGVDYYCCDPRLFGYAEPPQFWPVKCRRADGGPLPPGSATPPVAAKAPPTAPPAQKATPLPAPPARAPGAPLPLAR